MNSKSRSHTGSTGAQFVDWERITRAMAWGADTGIDLGTAAGTALWGGLRGAGVVARQVWVADRPRRQIKRTARRRRWWRKRGWWRFLLAAEAVGVGGWLVARSSWRLARATPSMASGAWSGAGQGWTQGREQAKTRARFGPPPVVEVTVEHDPRPRPARKPEVILDAEVVEDTPTQAATTTTTTTPAPAAPTVAAPAYDDPTGTRSRRLDRQPETDADRRFFALRESGYTGWINQDGTAVDGPEFANSEVETRIGDHVRLPDGSVGQAVDPDTYAPGARPGDWARLPDGSMGQITAVMSFGVQVATPDGQRWVVPVDAPTPASPSAAIPQETTTQEESPMSTPTVQMTGSQLGGELHSPADLLSEIAQVNGLAERAATVQAEIDAWARGLGDQVTASPWGTGAVAQAADGVSEYQTMADLRDRISVLHSALDQADALGESLSSIGATGSVEALAAQ
jgi:hypothetical protein